MYSEMVDEELFQAVGQRVIQSYTGKWMKLKSCNYTVTWRLKCEIVEGEETSIARQRQTKQVFTAR
jgi:hypothetical protein